jgi:hypothetical protein
LKAPFKYVEIEWTDANSGTGWETHDKLAKIIPVLTRGWLVYEDVYQVVVAGTWSPDQGENGKEQYNQTIAIPMGMVVNLREVGA